MARRAVTLSTDGARDYVETPEGVKYILGPVSVLTVISKLVPMGAARRALDEFNAEGSVMVVLDTEQLFEMLAPRRSRFASPLIQGQDRLGPSFPVEPLGRASERLQPKGTVMAADADKALKDAVVNQIAAIERQIGVLNQKASESGGEPAASMKAEVAKLQDLVAWLKRPSPYGDQSDNSDTYGLKPETPGGVKAASYASLEDNAAVAEEILSKVGATTDKIDLLVERGRRFNASQAREDLHDITSRVAEILANVDLAQPWVKNDLRSLAERAAHIHSLFANAK